METHKVAYLNQEVAYSISGKGPVVVWLHGFMEDKSIWHKQLEVFDAYFTNICVDLLGHGASDNVQPHHSMLLHANGVEAVLEHLNIDTFSLIGHSMGGYIALAMEKTGRFQVQHLVLLNSTSRRDSQEKKMNRLRAIDLIEKGQKELYIRTGIMQLFSPDKAQELQVEIQNLLSKSLKMTDESIIASLLGMKSKLDHVAVLQSFIGPKLIISGRKDTIIPLEASKYEAMLTKSKHIILEGGHMSHLEAPSKLNEVLLEFLQKPVEIVEESIKS